MSNQFDASMLAEKLVPMLLPLLPYLIKAVKKAGEKFSEAIGEKSGERAVEVAQKLWGKLKPKVEQDPATQRVIQEAAEDPTKPYLPGTLTYQLKNLLEDENLRQELVEIIAHGEKEGVTLKSFIEAGNVYGEVTGIKVVNLDALEGAGLISSKIKADLVGKGGKVTGMEL